jgi:predicted nucleic acid-binding protein
MIRMVVDASVALKWFLPEPLAAARHTITAYDGLCLALAAGHRCQLVTADRRLYEICRATEMAPWLVWVGELPGPQG